MNAAAARPRCERPLQTTLCMMLLLSLLLWLLLLLSMACGTSYT